MATSNIHYSDGLLFYPQFVCKRVELVVIIIHYQGSMNQLINQTKLEMNY